MKNIVILISGRGSNMQAIVDAAYKENWAVNIAAVVSNRPNAEGLVFARERNIPVAVVDHDAYASRLEFDRALQLVLDQFSPDYVILAGFMRILTPEFVLHYKNRLLNIHPSLLPLFPGLHTHRQALAAGVLEHGATVHWVTEILDHGPILMQAKVPVLPDDTEASLAARVLAQEHILYPKAIRSLLEKKDDA
jgi:phosphoribosylglycinamide formyltransferase-1